MKIRYDKEDDVMMVWLSKEPVSYAEKNRSVIIHFSKDDKPVLMEILDAYEFLKLSSSKLPQDMRNQVFAY
ncbi:MAG: hypothetical protein ACD_19C00431G0005 [uncultured bacterium]|nr:MAG: hypothetical protein ACD_19C00431G0005 [uncultured bacterium]